MYSSYTIFFQDFLYIAMNKYQKHIVPPFNGPSDERTPAMSGHYLDVWIVLPC